MDIEINSGSFVPKEHISYLREVSKMNLLEREGRIEGAYEKMDERAYHHRRSPGLSSSGLVKIGKKSYGHYISGKSNPMEETPSMSFGTAFHKSLLEPEEFKETYILAPEPIEKPEHINRRTKIGKQEYADWQELVEKPHLEKIAQLTSGKKILTPETFDRLEKMTEMAKSHPTLKLALEGALYEVSFFWKCPETGLLLKCRTDIVNIEKKIIIDVKTALDASANGFGRACVNFDYDVKAEFYIQILEGLYGGEWDYFFYACEKEPPYAPAAHYFPDSLRENAKRGVETWKKKAVSAIDGSGNYLYSTEPIILKLPNYAYFPDRFED